MDAASQDLDRHLSIELHIAGGEDPAHPAVANLALDRVSPIHFRNIGEVRHGAGVC